MYESKYLGGKRIYDKFCEIHSYTIIIILNKFTCNSKVFDSHDK